MEGAFCAAFWIVGGEAKDSYGPWSEVAKYVNAIDPVYDRTTWRDGMAFPDATQLGLGKALLESFPWSRFEPHPEWVEPDCFAAGIPGEVRFVYKPKRGIYDRKGPVVKGLEPNVPHAAFYFDPVRGTRSDLGPVVASAGEYRPPRLPSPQDWVLVIERRDP